MRFLTNLAALAALLFASVTAEAQSAGGRRVIFGGGGSSLISSFNADGWSATTQAISKLTFLPDTSPQGVSTTEQGYDTSGNATTYTRSLVITKQVRFPYPSQASRNPSRVAMSDWAWTTTSLPGVTNNSTLTAPQPIMAWVHAGDRQTIYNNTLHLEFVAASVTARAGKQIPYASCSATDGTTTVTTAATGPGILTSTTDVQPVIGYYCDLNITSLAAGQITANAKGYPWYGSTASIADSSTGTAGTRGWVPQIFTKSASTRYYANAASGGNDTSCVASQTVATALATPCATYVGAVNKCRTTSGDAGNCTIRLGAGTWVTASGSASSAATSEMIVEGDPNASAGTVILQFGATSLNLNVKFVRFRNLSLSRQGVNAIQTVTGGRQAFENIAYDAANGSFNVSFDTSGGGGSFINGMTITNQLAPTLSLSTTSQDMRLVRGVSNVYSATVVNVAPGTIVGCKFYNAIVQFGSSTQFGNLFIGFDKFLKNGQTSNPIISVGSNSSGQTATLSNFALIQSVFEWSGNNSANGAGISADPPIYTTLNNVVVDYVTTVGAHSAGRWNIFYDNNSNTTVRTHTNIAFRNSIISQFNIKGDMFVATNGADTADAPLHFGNWGPYYGAGFKNVWYSYADAGGHYADGNYTSDFSQIYAGLNARLGTSTTVRLDPLFTSYQATTYNGTTYSAGAGDGDYSLQAGSTAKGRVSESTLPFDLAGTARPSSGDTVGAYK